WMPPAIMITLTILSINFVGEGLKDAFNPRGRR
ncbi:TPA: ABC transporter permease, partial [Staphylococcus aureus]|nr:ABC transporter permease [Staphylococcus aureus]